MFIPRKIDYLIGTKAGKDADYMNEVFTEQVDEQKTEGKDEGVIQLIREF